MPSQWRTIAPIVGRTAAQCLEHYEKLLYVILASIGYENVIDYDGARGKKCLRATLGALLVLTGSVFGLV
jgi:hypothetical protein